MKTTSKTAIAILLLAALGAAATFLLRGTRGPDAVAPLPKASAPPVADGAPPARLAASPTTARGDRVTSTRPEDASAPAQAGVDADASPPRETPDSQRVPAPAGEITGRVLHLKDRSPAVGAEVRLLGHEGAPAAGTALPAILVVVTGADGAFRLAGFPPQTYLLRASMAGHSEVMFHARVVEGAGVGGVDVLIGPGGTIEGRVTDARGAPVEGLVVDLQMPADQIAGYMESTHRTTKSDAEGAYRFSDVTPAQCWVTVKRGDGREQRRGVGVREGETARLDFASAAVLSGLLLGDAQAPIAGVGVLARPSVDYGRGVEAVTDAQGRFRLEGLEPGDWRITVGGGRILGFNGEVARQTVAAGENEITLDLGSAAEVGGRVESRLLGKALPWPEVQLLLLRIESTEVGGRQWAEGTLPTVAFADKDGRFRLRGLRAGSYRLYADAGMSGHAHWERDFEFLAGERKAGVDVFLERSRPGKAQIAVKDEAGKPMGEIRFEVLANGLGRSITATSSEPGVYALSLEAGPTTVAVETANWTTAQVTVDVREGETVSADVVLRPNRPR